MIGDSERLVSETFEQHRPELERFALYLCRDTDTAQDLVQEAFLRLLVEVEADRPPANVSAWLHRVIGNLNVSLGRHASVRRRYAAAVAMREDPIEPEDVVIAVEEHSKLAAVVSKLPCDARTALLLSAQGYTGQEISGAIGRTNGATRSMMCRARSQVRSEMSVAGAVA